MLGYAKAWKLLFLSTLSCNIVMVLGCVGLTLCYLLVLRVVGVLTNVYYGHNIGVLRFISTLSDSL